MLSLVNPLAMLTSLGSFGDAPGFVISFPGLLGLERWPPFVTRALGSKQRAKRAESNENSTSLLVFMDSSD